MTPDERRKYEVALGEIETLVQRLDHKDHNLRMVDAVAVKALDKLGIREYRATLGEFHRPRWVAESEEILLPVVLGLLPKLCGLMLLLSSSTAVG